MEKWFESVLDSIENFSFAIYDDLTAYIDGNVIERLEMLEQYVNWLFILLILSLIMNFIIMMKLNTIKNMVKGNESEE